MELASSVDTRASTAPGSPGTYPISWGPKRLLLLLFPCHKAHALCWPTGAMKGVLVPILILWVGCCSGEALAKQGLSTREFIAPPAPAALPIVQPPPSSSRSSNGISCQSGPGALHQQKDWDRHQNNGSSTSEATGCVQKKLGSRQGQGPRLTEMGTTEQFTPSSPALCPLAQTAIAYHKVKMKHAPTLVDPGLTTLYLEDGWPHCGSWLAVEQCLALGGEEQQRAGDGALDMAAPCVYRQQNCQDSGPHVPGTAQPGVAGSEQEQTREPRPAPTCLRVMLQSFYQLSRTWMGSYMSQMAQEPLHNLLYLRLDQN
ncbi:uncharacterized protein LOC115069685 isoform X2 [Nannospalax galili]|uniref:uncharacterized protein LOC115069685 isoform X2 n=1 Tax=Nannospalax galili TaxID=1026970 RepID=UPI00111C84FE|nr:uncharacterized protein LOC115069685 isoform X2 [Nannospalax galili]